MPEVKFTEGEMRLFSAMMSNLKGDVNTDWDKVAAIMNYKNASIGKITFSRILRTKIKAPQESTDKEPGVGNSDSKSLGKSPIRKSNSPRHAGKGPGKANGKQAKKPKNSGDEGKIKIEDDIDQANESEAETIVIRPKTNFGGDASGPVHYNA